MRNLTLTKQHCFLNYKIFKSINSPDTANIGVERLTDAACADVVGTPIHSGGRIILRATPVLVSFHSSSTGSRRRLGRKSVIKTLNSPQFGNVRQTPSAIGASIGDIYIRAISAVFDCIIPITSAIAAGTVPVCFIETQILTGFANPQVDVSVAKVV